MADEYDDGIVNFDGPCLDYGFYLEELNAFLNIDHFRVD